MLVGGAVGFRGVLCLVRMAVASLLADLEPEFKRRKGTSCSGSACKELGSCHSVVKQAKKAEQKISPTRERGRVNMRAGD